MTPGRYRLLPILLLLPAVTLVTAAGAPARAQTPPARPSIAIVIDDIGYRHREDLRAIALPGPLAYAVMPHSPHSLKMSKLAVAQGKDVLLHLPMQPIEETENRFLGPGALKLDMTQKQFLRTLKIDLRAVPDAIGVNNHMGSLLSQDPRQMEWLMDTLNRNNKFYIDSLTIGRSVASRAALDNRVPYLRRDVFLDNRLNEDDIQVQFDELVTLAHQRGKALAIGHPHPETINVLARNLDRLEEYGVELVRVTELLGDAAEHGISHPWPVTAGGQ